MFVWLSQSFQGIGFATGGLFVLGEGLDRTCRFGREGSGWTDWGMM